MIVCDNPACHADITEIVRQKRHYTMGKWPHFIYCNLDCEVVHRQSIGFYKAISIAGREKRSKAVAESNHLNPRRKRMIERVS